MSQVLLISAFIMERVLGKFVNKSFKWKGNSVILWSDERKQNAKTVIPVGDLSFGRQLEILEQQHLSPVWKEHSPNLTEHTDPSHKCLRQHGISGSIVEYGDL